MKFKKNINCSKILVITPALSGGSWICVEKILIELAHANSIKIYVLGLGKVFHRKENFVYHSIPYPRYDKWGFITVFHSLIALIWNLPLYFFAFILLFIHNPDLIITNGFAVALPITPIIKLLGKKIAVSYHGYVENIGLVTRLALINIGKSLDLVIVNSKGSYDNLQSFIPTERIHINEHFADSFFFDKVDKINHDKKISSFVIMYVGRLDDDKLCMPLIQIAENLKNNSKFMFEFIGVGKYSNQLINLQNMSNNIKYLGYISNRNQLKRLYVSADVVWSYADESYLALPAIESLACGTPIMIPTIAAIKSKIDKLTLINRDLVPDKIGWLVDPFNYPALQKLILKLENNREQIKMMRSQCLKHALLKYQSKNLTETLYKVSELLV